MRLRRGNWGRSGLSCDGRSWGGIGECRGSRQVWLMIWGLAESGREAFTCLECDFHMSRAAGPRQVVVRLASSHPRRTHLIAEAEAQRPFHEPRALGTAKAFGKREEIPTCFYSMYIVL